MSQPAKHHTALILAASRAGAEDAVAKSQNVSHKCLIDLDGTIMLERVVATLVDSQCCKRIVIAIESVDIVRQIPSLAQMIDAGELEVIASQDNLFTSIEYAARQLEPAWPLLITTGDNALHTPDMVQHFCNELGRLQPDVAVAMTPASVILDAYPDGKRAFHELKDGGWSSCNLYALQNAAALQTAKAFEGGGQFGKRPSRLFKAFGLMFVILYKFKLASLDQLAQKLSHRWNLNIQAIRMPFADAPIDVDNVGDMHRTQGILEKRREATES